LHECDQLSPRIEDSIEPADEGDHDADFRFSLQNHDPAGK